MRKNIWKKLEKSKRKSEFTRDFLSLLTSCLSRGGGNAEASKELSKLASNFQVSPRTDIPIARASDVKSWASILHTILRRQAIKTLTASCILRAFVTERVHYVCCVLLIVLTRHIESTFTPRSVFMLKHQKACRDDGVKKQRYNTEKDAWRPGTTGKKKYAKRTPRVQGKLWV